MLHEFLYDQILIVEDKSVCDLWAGVLWIDTMSVCSACIKETLQLFAGGWYVSIRIRLLFKNRLYFFFEFRQVVYHYAPENIG